MANSSLEFRIVVDPLYGLTPLDPFLADLVVQPEVQRLRHVRLSNINSELMNGAANISRFEHSLGAALLATRVADHLGLAETDRRRLVCAALLHDVGITPFGHLMEEALHYANIAFDHEKRLSQIFRGEASVGNIDFQIYRGRTVGFRKVLEKKPFRGSGISSADILELIQGNGALGPLINGSIDLDNIDNVCRMAYHIGLPFPHSLPQEVADVFCILDQSVCLDADKSSSVASWIDLRYRLYSLLMTNPIDFSAKAMLIEAIRVGLQGDGETQPILKPDDWCLTDGELLSRLRTYPPAHEILTRFDLGDVYDVTGMFWIALEPQDLNSAGLVECSRNLQESIRQRANLDPGDVLVYSIKDKRSRAVSGRWAAKNGKVKSTSPHFSIGENSTRVLIGAVKRKKSWNLRGDTAFCVQELFGERVVEECDPSKHFRAAFRVKEAEQTEQPSLF